MALAIGEVHLLATHDGGKVLEVVGNGPVERDVAERCLGAPAAGGVDAVDEGLDALLDFLLIQVVDLDEGGQVGVEGRERLGAGPFVLHDAEEVDHLVAQRGKMRCRRGSDFAGNAAQAFLDELLQAPTSAVTGEHGQVVQMDGCAAVSFGDLVVVNLGEPVVRRDGAGVRKDEAADGIGDRGVLLDAPVVDLEVVVDEVLVVEQCGIDITHLLALTTVQDVGLGDIGITGFGEDFLDAVLNILDRNLVVDDLVLEVGGDMKGDQIDNAWMVLLAERIECLRDCRADLADVEINDFSVSLDYLVHIIPLLVKRFALARTLCFGTWLNVPVWRTNINILCQFRNLFNIYCVRHQFHEYQRF